MTEKNNNTISPQAAREVLCVLEHSTDSIKNRVPLTLIDFFQQIQDTKHGFTYNTSKRLTEQNLMEETEAILAVVYREFILSPKQRDLAYARDDFLQGKDAGPYQSIFEKGLYDAYLYKFGAEDRLEETYEDCKLHGLELDRDLDLIFLIDASPEMESHLGSIRFVLRNIHHAILKGNKAPKLRLRIHVAGGKNPLSDRIFLLPKDWFELNDFVDQIQAGGKKQTPKEVWNRLFLEAKSSWLKNINSRCVFVILSNSHSSSFTRFNSKNLLGPSVFGLAPQRERILLFTGEDPFWEDFYLASCLSWRADLNVPNLSEEIIKRVLAAAAFELSQ